MTSENISVYFRDVQSWNWSVQMYILYVICKSLSKQHFFQTEMTAEEKRQEHQRELANKMNEEARERMKGLKGDNEEKKSVTGICITLFIC